MNEIILNYIVQSILGGASGYITNDYAINMLFKEYTPLKIGGVIKKTRHEFIENISSMVEKDIINKEKLKDILNDENFIIEFENMAVDFFKNSLYERTGNDTFSNIDGFEKTMESAHVFVADAIKMHMPEIYGVIAESISFEDFLNIELLSNTTSHLYTAIEEIFNNTNIFEDFLLSVLKNNEHLSLKNIISMENAHKVIVNSVDLLSQAMSNSDDEKIWDILTSIDFEKNIDSSLEILMSKKVKEVINLDENLIGAINESMLNYINTEKGNILIEGLTNSLFSYLKECNKSILELLDSSFENNLKQYLMNNIPSLTENVVEWLKLNSPLIDKLIDESIDEVIKESDGLKAKLLSVIKNTYLSDLSKKYSIVDKIIAYVNEVSEPEKLSQSLSSKIIEILNNLTVREIILEAEKNHVTIENAKKFILDYINKNSKSMLCKAASKASEVELKRLIPYGMISERLKTITITNVKKLAASDFAKKNIINKLYESFDNAMSKELNELIGDRDAIVFKLKEFIAYELKINESSIKTWINKELEAAKSYPLKLSPNLTSRLDEELLAYYKNATGKLSDERISTLWDKLNSIDSLAKNSSESIRAYAIENSDVTLSGSIKAIAADNLNKLNDEELVDLANDFIGRELKPIMYFGGVLGVIGGLILATFQNKPLNTSEINIASLIVYALVGYLTNVIAINMIFKPYKENKLLSKLPFFRNFSIGYIVKNQKTFAKSTAHFIDNSLLSKDSINDLFEKYRDKIKLSFVNSIADNNYGAVNKLIYENKRNAVNSLFMFLKKSLKKNSNSVSAFTYKKIKSIDIVSLIDENAVAKLGAWLAKKFKGNEISSYLYCLLHSNKTIESKLSENLLKTYINKQANMYLNKLEMILSHKNELNTAALRYEDKYQEYIDKTIGEAIVNNKENLVQYSSEKLKAIVLSKESREAITKKTASLIDKSIDKEKSFEELFNGKFKAYMDSKIPDLIEKITLSMIKGIKESKSKISLMVQSEIKSNLGFIEKSMYSLMGGDEIIDELLTKIIMVKAPVFLNDKKLEINSMASMLLQEKFYKAKVHVLYTGINKSQLNELIDSYIDGNSMKIENNIDALTREMLAKSENIKISSALKVFYADKLNSLLSVHQEEIDAFAANICLSVNNNKSMVIEKVTVLTDSLTHDFLQHKFNDVFKGITENDIKVAHEKIYETLYANNIESLIKKALNDCRKSVSLNAEELIDKDKFIEAVEKNIENIIEYPKLEERVKNLGEAIIDEAVLSNFSFISHETKNYLLNIFVDSCLSSLKARLNELLKSIEFDEIAQAEIEKMEPEKIHEMFDSFAGKYFKRLMLYGFGGFVFGINMYMGFSLVFFKILSETFKRGSHK